MTEKPNPSSPAPWPLVSSRPGPPLVIFRARIDTVTNPRTAKAMDRIVLETPAWANVVAITPAKEVVLVRQYRFGIRAVTTEIPGGVIEPGESPEEAARRELLEETGYRAPRWKLLGVSEPNPAFHDNLCHHFLAEDAELVAEPTLDPGEDVAVLTLPLATVARAVRDGSIRHALVVTALARVLDLRD